MFKLVPHPDHPPRAVRSLTVESAADPDHLGLTFRLSGDLDSIRLPELGKLRREDRLWRSTCFEIFLRHGPANGGYREYNFAPDGRWSAYRFGSYRHARSNLPQRCTIAAARDGDDYVLTAHILSQPIGGHDVGLSAIIEEADGRVSYWALAHPDGKADFHHADCFALSGDDL